MGDKTQIDDTSPDEHVLAASQNLIPLFADLVNYLSRHIVPPTCPIILVKSSGMMSKGSFGMIHTYIGVMHMVLFGVVCRKLRC